MDVILPHAAAHDYRVPAKRFGYILRVAKERYKDNSLDLRDAGAKIRALINEHLISLGINPQVAPVELLDEKFIEKLNQNASGNDEAKASEMEHAIRKHCTVHHDEDPAFYKKLSEKVENLITQHRDDWSRLASELEKLRAVAIEGRVKGEDGMSREATTFFEHIAFEVFPGGEVPQADRENMKVLTEALVEIMQETIGSIDFWNNADKQKRLRSEVKRALMLSKIDALKEKRERITIEVVRLAKNRHNDLLRGAGEEAAE